MNPANTIQRPTSTATAAAIPTTCRLRGATASPYGLRFSLAIQGAASLACVNGGETSSPTRDHDQDGLLNQDDAADYAAEVPPGAFRDPAYRGNAGVVNLLNALGAVLGLSDVHQEPFAPGWPVLGEITVSNLGRLVVQNRPPGGYLSLEPLRKLLSPVDFAKVEPYLSVTGEIVTVPFPPWNNGSSYFTQADDPEQFYEFHALLDINTTPLPLLKAALRNLCASGGLHAFTDSPLQYKTDYAFVRLGEGEADQIAEILVDKRPIRSWQHLLTVLTGAEFDGAFQDDPFTQAVDDSAGERRRLKEDLFLAQADTTPFLADPFSWAMNSLEVPRDIGPPTAGTDFSRVRRITKGALQGPLNTAPFNSVGVEKPSLYDTGTDAPIWDIPTRMTTEFLIDDAGPTRFSIQAEGWVESLPSNPPVSCRLSGDVALGGSVLFTSQQDFEQMGSSPTLPRQYAGGDVRAVGESPQTFPRNVRSFPRLNLRSYTPESIWRGSLPPEVLNSHQFHRVLGQLRLSPKQWTDAELTAAECVFSLPFNEDGPPLPGNLYNPLAWTDNLGDPIAIGPPPLRPSNPALAFNTQDPPPAEWQSFHRGIRFNSFGYRDAFAAQGPLPVDPLPALRTQWNASDATQIFPLERDDLIIPPLTGAGRIRQGIITFWMPDVGGEDPAPGHFTGGFDLEYRASGLYELYLCVRLDAAGRVAITNGYGTTFLFTPPWLHASTPTHPRSAWHHTALQFDATGQLDDVTGLIVFLDGVRADLLAGNPILPIPLPFQVGAAPASRQMRLLIPRGPIDDIAFFRNNARLVEILDQALLPRYAPEGEFVSGRFAFNSDSFPKGGDTAVGLLGDLYPFADGRVVHVRHRRI